MSGTQANPIGITNPPIDDLLALDVDEPAPQEVR